MNDNHANLYCFNTYIPFAQFVSEFKAIQRKKTFIYKICLCKHDFHLLYFFSLLVFIGMHRKKLWYNMLTKLNTISEIEMLQYLHGK